MKQMKAWVARHYGKPENVLRLETVPVPEPWADQVLIRILSSSINPIDLRMVQGYGARLRRLTAPVEFPYITGRDIVGEVVQAGADVTKFKVGDRVVGITDIKESGAHAEYSAVRETSLALAPDSLSASELAAVPYVGMTTWTALVSRLGMDPDRVAGKHLFVQAGSGGIGSFTIQWAHSLGMKVSTTCSGENLQWVRDLGADTVINYKTEDYREIVSDVDYAYDTLGGSYAEDTARLVRRGGGYASIVHPIMPLTDQRGLVLGGLSILAGLMSKRIAHGLKGRKYAWSICQPNEQGIEHIVGKMAKREIKAVIAKDLPMDAIQDGYAYVATGSAKGKVVLNWT